MKWRFILILSALVAFVFLDVYAISRFATPIEAVEVTVPAVPVLGEGAAVVGHAEAVGALETPEAVEGEDTREAEGVPEGAVDEGEAGAEGVAEGAVDGGDAGAEGVAERAVDGGDAGAEGVAAGAVDEGDSGAEGVAAGAVDEGGTGGEGVAEGAVDEGDTGAEGALSVVECDVALRALLEGEGRITFEPYSGKPDEAGLARLEEVVGLLQRCPEARGVIVGYHDNRGEPNKIRNLTQRRAYHVYLLLQEMGVDGERFTYVGRGYRNMRYWGAAKRHLNQRVEFQLEGVE